jgi:hypothetical protein
VWGLGLLRPFKKALGGLTHLLVTVNKFTKWIKVRPRAKIGPKQAMNFITDNGTQFTREKFLDLCDDNNIRVDWAAVAHQRTNG